MVASAKATETAAGLRRGWTALLCLDPRFIAGKMMLVRSFVTGMNIVAVAPGANPLSFLPPQTTIDFTALVPYQVRSVLSSPTGAAKLGAMQSILIGGAELDSGTRSQLDTLSTSTSVYATYGMTETLSHIALQKLNKPGAQDYFQLLPGIQIQNDDRGCLVIGAAYLGSEKIITNDLVELIGNDRFRWLGRFDNVINTGGVKVIPEKVEKEISKLFTQLGISNRFFLAGLPDASLGNKVTLIIEGTLPIEDHELIQKLKGIITRFETPKEIRRVAKFVETDTQKINRKATIAGI